MQMVAAIRAQHMDTISLVQVVGKRGGVALSNQAVLQHLN
jgi:hypothetical protein